MDNNEKPVWQEEASSLLPITILAPAPAARESSSRSKAWSLAIFLLVCLSGLLLVFSGAYGRVSKLSIFNSTPEGPYAPGSFYSLVKTQEDICPGENGVDKVSRSGLFEAQQDAENAPLILTHGGGPGTSGLFNTVLGQNHCVMRRNGSFEHNPNAWSEKYNVLVLDHPIGAGFSYGSSPNNSRAAAADVYDFLQKIFVLFPHLATAKLTLASGSYGGVYIPHIATEIHTQNIALADGHGEPGARYINLESMMVSNPMSDILSHFRWALDVRCQNPIFNVYNETQCAEGYVHLPECLDALQYALDFPSAEVKAEALTTCEKAAPDIDPKRGRMLENVKVECDGSLDGCVPELVQGAKYLNDEKTKEMLGVPQWMNWTSVNYTVHHAFYMEGDMVQRAHLLYGPLVSDGIRLLHYVGALDANCGWSGIYHFLKYIQTPFQPAFLTASDVQWHPNATVRAIGDGDGAGNFTWILMSEAGHLVVRDQPELVKMILERWIEDLPWV
ncbi:hypothetical protein EIP91_000287 [Steccherinum ochraceum]|uniref:Uncharacterized protein n=1 Tax=Steccherinum ochraceum TaxID=92696 RepID=A0A4V2MWR9_9APHY|nr:hypothetical protein EIP91_000287 [Steccherinum ochraceum]